MVKQVMSEVPSSIIPCPECKVKNRVKQFHSDKIPFAPNVKQSWSPKRRMKPKFGLASP